MVRLLVIGGAGFIGVDFVHYWVDEAWWCAVMDGSYRDWVAAQYSHVSV